MKRSLLIFFWMLAIPGGASAHSMLETTVPAAESIVEEIPEELVMTFTSGIRLTRVSMTHADDAPVDLDLSELRSFTSEFSIPIEPMGSGTYLIEWRGLGDDGHAMNGSFEFMVD